MICFLRATKNLLSTRISFSGLHLCSFFLITLGLTACNNRKDVDLSNIDLTVTIERFDRDLGSLKVKTIQQQAPLLQKKYGNFYSDFMDGMLGAGHTADTSYYANLRTILSSRDFNALKDEVDHKYPDMSKQESELTDAFKHVKYYYPGQKLPRLISFFSGFAVQTPIGNDYIGIGLDMFLGADSKFYPAIRQSVPLYISKKFTPENITPRVMETFIREEIFPEPESLNTLLDRMIYNGKILYFMDATMPAVSDSLKIGYTAAQLDWCKTFEPQIWAYFLENNLLYDTDYMKIQKYLTEAPFTPGIGEKNESAPKLALYIGWQIVKKYMDVNSNIKLQDLMKDPDYQMILSKSKYKPK
ncbi:gliding motility lipoprotein GldB [Desertivirga xinjiangensis]|uniref:gliding motility lipoprotein GldB n=1 Tax=Desertivirga xinjiangensis TaxID=539206 RepID=UPI00210C0F69|nr:gliding motility lipoprotein GldB [Pedobacter xinjiangensis]